MKRIITMLALCLLAVPAQAQVIQGRTPTGRNQPIRVAEDGTLTATTSNTGAVTAPTSGPGVETATALTSASLATNGTLATWDFTGFKGVAFTINGVTGQGTVSPQCSNDNTTWTTCLMTSALSGAYVTSTTTTAQPFYFPATSRYGRLVLTGWVSGTWTVTGFLRQLNLDPGQVTTPQLPASLGVKADTASVSFAQAASSNVLAGAVYTASPAVTTGTVIKATAGNLYGLNVASGATAGFVILINAATVPADGAIVPVKCYQIATNTAIDLNYRATPIAFPTGIVAVFSSTGCFVKTTSATAFISGDYR